MHQYSKSSATRAICPRMSPRRIRAGSIWAAIFFRSRAFRDVGPQPSHEKPTQVSQSKEHEQKEKREDSQPTIIAPLLLSTSSARIRSNLGLPGLARSATTPISANSLSSNSNLTCSLALVSDSKAATLFTSDKAVMVEKTDPGRADDGRLGDAAPGVGGCDCEGCCGGCCCCWERDCKCWRCSWGGGVGEVAYGSEPRSLGKRATALVGVCNGLRNWSRSRESLDVGCPRRMCSVIGSSDGVAIVIGLRG